MGGVEGGGGREKNIVYRSVEKWMGRVLDCELSFLEGELCA